MQLGEEQYLSLDGLSIMFKLDEAGNRWFQSSWLVAFLQVREKALVQSVDTTQTWWDGASDYISEYGLKKFLLENQKPEWDKFTKLFVLEPEPVMSEEVPKENKKFQHDIPEGHNLREALRVAYFGDQRLRFFVDKNTVWFFARDICAILGFANAWRTMAEKVPYTYLWKRASPVDKIRNKCLFVHERGVIPLSERSRLPETPRFTRWFVDDLMPALHATGFYKERPRKAKAVAKALPPPMAENTPEQALTPPPATSVDKLFEEAEGIYLLFLRRGFDKEQAIDAALNSLKPKMSVDISVLRALFGEP